MLTNSQCKAAKGTGKVYKIRDGKHGLFLRITASGGKSWGQRLSINGRKHELGLGNFPLVSLADARKRAFCNHASARQGIDPRVARQPVDAPMTFRQASDAKLDLKRGEWKEGSSSIKAWEQSMSDYVFAVIGTVPVRDVNNEQVYAILHPLSIAKYETANKVSGRISSVLEWAIATGKRERANIVPAVFAQLPRISKPVHHKAVDWRKVGQAIVAIRGTGIMEVGKDASVFLILTAARTGEVMGMKFSEVEKNIWTVPANRIKEGVEHKVPLAKAALAILRRRRKATKGDLVFPGISGGELSEKFLRNALASAKVKDATGHGFRNSFTDWARNNDVSDDVRKCALAHAVKDRVDAAYARDRLLDKRRAVMERWADHCVPTARGLERFAKR